jgi:perosamine synthetase
MTHSFIPLAKPEFSKLEKKLVNNCLDTGWISSIGKYVGQFGEDLAKYVGVKYALPTSSGTSALHLALIALGIGPNDEVIVPALTFVASVNVITYVGAKPVFIDIEPDTFNLDISKLESLITNKTKAIMTVDLYGHPVDFDAVNKIAKKHNLIIISDSAESLGSKYKGKPTGSQADISIFSFFGNKIITTGEGGMVVTSSKKLYDTCKLYRDQGKDTSFHNYYHPVIGYNYGFTNLQAAVGIGQLKRIKSLVSQKRAIATQYKKLLKDIKGLSFQQEQAYAQSNWWMFSILVDEKEFGCSRDELILRLKAKKIETRPFFYPMHMLPPYKTGLNPSDFPEALKISEQGMNLPSFASLSLKDIQYICHSIRSAT